MVAAGLHEGDIDEFIFVKESLLDIGINPNLLTVKYDFLTSTYELYFD